MDHQDQLDYREILELRCELCFILALVLVLFLFFVLVLVLVLFLFSVLVFLVFVTHFIPYDISYECSRAGSHFFLLFSRQPQISHELQGSLPFLSLSFFFLSFFLSFFFFFLQGGAGSQGPPGTPVSSHQNQSHETWKIWNLILWFLELLFLGFKFGGLRLGLWNLWSFCSYATEF